MKRRFERGALKVILRGLITACLAAGGLLLPSVATPANATGSTFTQTEPVDILTDYVAYSALDVSGLPGTVFDVDVTLQGLSHGKADELDVILVAPNGSAATVMSDAGSETLLNHVTLTFDDQATGGAPGNLISGRYQRTDVDPIGDIDFEDADATLDELVGSTPINGTWELYVADESLEIAGHLDAWSLTFTAPDRPTISSPVDGSATLVNPLAARGTGTPRSRVYVSVDQQTPRALIVGQDGNWATDFTGLADGTHIVRASTVLSGGDATNTVSAMARVDTQNPTGTFTIRTRYGTPELTSSRRVDLVIQASEQLRGVRVSNDGEPYGALIPLASTLGGTVAWTLGEHDGTRRVFIQLEDLAGRVSQGYLSDSVGLDQVAPLVIRTWPEAGAKGVRRDKVVRARFNDFVTPNPATSLRWLARIYRVGSTSSIGATVSYNADTATVRIMPRKLLRRDTRYKVVIGGFRDTAGNFIDQDPTKAGDQPKRWRFRTR